MKVYSSAKKNQDKKNQGISMLFAEIIPFKIMARTDIFVNIFIPFTEPKMPLALGGKEAWARSRKLLHLLAV